jgi:diguanylate cyclase (GGDEF)-like protein
LNSSSKERLAPGYDAVTPLHAGSHHTLAGARPADVAGWNGQPQPDQPFELDRVLQNIGETAYRWDPVKDEMLWASNAAAVLDVADVSLIGSGRAFGLRIDSEQAGAHYETVTGGPKPMPDSEVRYRTHYRFLPDGRRGSKSLWLEDTGLCQIGADCRPKLIQGTLRVLHDACEREQRLRLLENHDELTGQLNRTRLTERLAEMLSNTGRNAVQGALLLVAVNDLSLVNETYGYEIGDQVISTIGRRIAQALRGKDCVGRFASNKFGVLLYGCSGPGITLIGRRLMGIVKDRTVETSGGSVATTISVGALTLPEHAGNAQLAIGRALQALETARQNHSDRFTIYQPSERRESERRRAAGIADEIVRALNERRMVLALQPVVTAKEHKTAFHECLLRMRKLDGSVLPAGEFMSVAAQFGLAKLIDCRVLDLAMELLKEMPGLRFALNVSAAAVTNDEWLARLEAIARQDRSLTERITIEIAESTAIANLDEMVDFVGAIKQLGCKVALDGFGTGYSSFRQLRRLGVDMVKIDASFIENLSAQADEGQFVRTLVDLARNFGMATVGEAVSDEATAETLERAGIDYMQGYVFGGPELIWPERERSRFDRA